MSEKEKYDFRYENSINFNKEYIEVDDSVDHKYASWRTNSVLSNFPDTVMYANELNCYPSLDNKLQYEYLFYSVRKKKRFFKKEKGKKDDNYELVRDYYKYNHERTKEALSILTEEQIKKIKEKTEKGGIK